MATTIIGGGISGDGLTIKWDEAIAIGKYERGGYYTTTSSTLGSTTCPLCFADIQYHNVAKHAKWHEALNAVLESK